MEDLPMKKRIKKLEQQDKELAKMPDPKQEEKKIRMLGKKLKEMVKRGFRKSPKKN